MGSDYKKVDADSSTPLPAQIKEALLDKIASGAFKPGEKILSETRLAESFGVSRITARQALMELISEGVLTRAHGRGTFVAEKPAPSGDGRVRFLMVIVPNLRTSFYHEIISGCEKVLSKNNIELLLRSVNEDPVQEKRCLEKAVEYNVCGVLLVAEDYSSDNLKLLESINREIPFAAADVAVKGLESDLVVSDDRNGGYLITKHLIEMGREKMLHLAGPSGDSSAEERLAGYRDALLEFKIAPEANLVRFTSWGFEEGYYEAKKFFMKPENSAAAVFACNDEVGTGAYRALIELGLKVPADVALAGYGNLACGRFLDVPLTTIDQSAELMGRTAGELLAQKIKCERELTDHKRVKIPTELIIRDSCGIKLADAARKTERRTAS